MDKMRRKDDGVQPQLAANIDNYRRCRRGRKVGNIGNYRWKKKKIVTDPIEFLHWMHFFTLPHLRFGHSQIGVTATALL